MDSVNRAWYSHPDAVHAFAGDDLLEPTLVVLLVKYRDWIVGKEVLDIGVGAGRTTLYLSSLTPRYVGIDYSSVMVRHTASRFPEARVESGDARDLQQFTSASFDFVLFSYAGLDALDHGSRLCALAEVARVLRPGGKFAFSTHNRGYVDARLAPHVRFSRNPVTQLVNVGRWVRQARNHARLCRLEAECEEFALINDLAENYSLIHYYIDVEHQLVQLTRAGFEVELVYDDQAREVTRGAPASGSPWLWFVARRLAS